jgi:phospholipase/lecithinase/hemolysin
MENQHRKITGYRELNQKEIDLMNKVKVLGITIESVLKEVQDHVSCTELDTNEILKRVIATPERFLALAKTEFQTGLMYATRAVAQPEFF